MTVTTRQLPRVPRGVHGRVLGGEVVVVDERTQSAHALKGPVAEAWQLLDRGDAESLATDEMQQALGELHALGLIEGSPGFTRRDVLRQAGTVLVAGTVITIALPTVHAAASHGKDATTTTLTGSLTRSGNNRTYTLTATTTASANSHNRIPTGVVEFFLESGATDVVVGSGEVSSTGLTITYATTGNTTRQFYAVYAGDAYYTGSLSTLLTL